MKLILHDLNENIEAIFQKDITSSDYDVELFSAHPKVKPCIACFGCWLKTPGMCIIEDRGQDFMKLLVSTNELHIVSRLLYGGLSTEIKALLDRSLGYILPYFDIKDDKMFHPPRYDNGLSIHYHIYPYESSSISESEKETMRGIAIANGRNLSSSSTTCTFYNNQEDIPDMLKEVLK